MSDLMMSNIADRTDASLLSDDELNAVSGGHPALWAAAGIFLACSAVIAGSMVAARNAPGTLDSGGRAGGASGGGASESGADRT